MSDGVLAFLFFCCCLFFYLQRSDAWGGKMDEGVTKFRLLGSQLTSAPHTFILFLLFFCFYSLPPPRARLKRGESPHSRTHAYVRAWKKGPCCCGVWTPPGRLSRELHGTNHARQSAGKLRWTRSLFVTRGCAYSRFVQYFNICIFFSPPCPKIKPQSKTKK